MEFSYSNGYVSLVNNGTLLTKSLEEVKKIEPQLDILNFEQIYWSEQFSFAKLKDTQIAIPKTLESVIIRCLNSIDKFKAYDSILLPQLLNTGNIPALVNSSVSSALMRTSVWKHILESTGKSSRLSAQYNTLLACLTIPLTIADVAICFNTTRSILQQLNSAEDFSTAALTEFKKILTLLNLDQEEIDLFDLAH